MRNDTHFQYHTNFRHLVNELGAAALKVEDQFDAYLLLYEQEDIVLKQIMKSFLTDEIYAAEQRRDRLFQEMIVSYRSARNHFREDVQASARRLKIVFDTYGKMEKKRMIDKSAAIHSILQDLNSKYTDDVALTGLTEWVEELGAYNETFNRMRIERIEEIVSRPNSALKEVRPKVDTAYRSIIKRINTLALIEEEDAYSDFIGMLNVIITKYSSMMAHLRGKTESNNEKKETN